ncbi:hypothetical protein J3R82DRAFT_2799 [Butyriboletus roseoflavus]|nr:hypothetical protein J3R82DRAFT_2799 [Butyriboletus roseoflavus]
MTDPIAELLMLKAPQIYMSGDTVLLDIEDVIPDWETYTFSLNTVHPGEKKIVLRIKHRAVNSQSVEVQTENVITSNEMFVNAASQMDSHEALTVPIEDPSILLEVELNKVSHNVTVAQSSHVISSSVPTYPATTPTAHTLQDI